ncbi:MAG: chemotaxis protein CheB [Ferruginibacter sp.]
MKPNNTNPKILSNNLFPVVGIGASAGGLDAFKKLIKAIPEDSGMAYVLVQHLHPSYESILPEILQKITSIPVLEIIDDIKVEPDHIYIIPSNKMLVANDGILQLSARPERSKTDRVVLPIDIFFKSLAEVHQSHAIGVVLSGTASDGTLGLKAIKDQGGITFAQDEASAEYDGMPNNAIAAGVVDFIMEPQEIPKKLLEIKAQVIHSDEDLVHLPNEEEETFKQILSLMRIRKNTDFTYYKQTTVRRRILRRMALNKNLKAVEYLSFLRENKIEQDALYHDLLIPVTEFFRDAKVFDNLCQTVFPQIVANKQPNEAIRIWVTACSTGQEAYSIAMCLRQYLGDHTEKFQIFATDISEPAIARARRGVYTEIELAGVSEQRLQEFFIKTNDGYQLIKSIRDACVFASHNFVKDPPFGRMDFISCRNVLIYMDPYLQKKALTTFHYALNPKGFLLLGKSETSAGVPDLFVPVAKADKLFTRKDVPGKMMHVASLRSEAVMNYHNSSAPTEPMRTDFQKTADDIMLSKYTPAGVVVNEEMDIVHFRGATSAFLEQFPGKPSHNLLKMARQGLAFELRNIIHKAKKENKAIVKENIPISLNQQQRFISIEAVPLPNLADPHYLILFHDNNNHNQLAPGRKKLTGKTKNDDKDLLIEQLEKELAQAREDMRSITEDQEAANEELQSANEELLSGSEELQSLNEELETSKEELQSSNEELTVVNHEIINLNHQVTSSRDYAEAIISTIREPLIVLDKKLRVRSANSSYYKLFKIDKSETVGKLIFDLGNKEWDIPALRELLEKILPEKSVLEDMQINHSFSFLGERTMLLNAREIINTDDSEKFILLAIEDITEKATAIKKIEESELFIRSVLDSSPDCINIIDEEGKIQSINHNGICLLEIDDFDKYKNKYWWNLWGKKEKQIIQDAHAKVIAGERVQFQALTKTAKGKMIWFDVIALPIEVNIKTKKVVRILSVSRDITLQKQQEIKEKELLNRFQNLQHKIADQLEEKVKQRTQELSISNEKLQHLNEELIRSNHELESFTYISSHDLQEPLRKIQTFANLILEKEFSVLSEEGKDYFNRMHGAALRMQTLIQDLLAYSLANVTDRKFEKINISNLVDDVKKELFEIIHEKNPVIKADNLDTVNINRFQIRQVISNLITNSIKFSKPDVPPEIIIKTEIATADKLQKLNPDFHEGSLTAKKKYCHISFQDNGIGFEPHYRHRIFDVFQRLHPKEEYPGTGIGLAIVKKIIENHNGYITSTGELGKGATFDIYIPV